MTTQSIATQESRLLSNAYAGLALLLLPTAAGAFLTATAFSGPVASHPLAFIVVECAAVFGLLFAVFANKDNASGFGFALGFAFFMGALTGPSIDYALHAHRNGSDLVALAALGTAGLFIGLSAYARITGGDFQGIRGILYAGLWGLLVAGFANHFLHSTMAGAAVSGAGVAVFSGYILFDTSEALHGREDNWLILSLSLYMDVMNLFGDILNLLSMFASEDD